MNIKWLSSNLVIYIFSYKLLYTDKAYSIITTKKLKINQNDTHFVQLMCHLYSHSQQLQLYNCNQMFKIQYLVFTKCRCVQVRVGTVGRYGGRCTSLHCGRLIINACDIIAPCPNSSSNLLKHYTRSLEWNLVLRFRGST